MSLILFGLGKKTYKDLGATGKEQSCVWCSCLVFYHLILIRTWFTYFFIPIFSYQSQYRIECPTCACGLELSSEEAKAAKRGELNLTISTAGTDSKQSDATTPSYKQSRR
jgi:hypothetical protein